MKRSMRKRKAIVALAITMLSLLLLPTGLDTYAAALEADQQLISTRTGLLDAIYSASEGDTIYVGDIDFNQLPPGWGTTLNSSKRVTVSKSLTFKSGKPDGSAAVLSGGSFILAGPILKSQNISCNFEDILFDGTIDGNTLALEDWDLVDTEPEPLKAQFAVTFKGNVDVRFSNCTFMRYMHDYGGAIFGRYGDYDWAQLGDDVYAYRDNKYCNLNISLLGCNFIENSAYYAGGAVYLDGLENNISFSAERCSFAANNSSVGRYDHDDGYTMWLGEGGGAIFARNAHVSLQSCDITGNIGNRVYGSANSDATHGGGIFCNFGTLAMTNCLVADNTASVGGGASLWLTETTIDGCVIQKNSASSEADFYWEDWDFSDEKNPVYRGLLDRQSTGMERDAGRGGGIYVSIEGPVPITIVNTAIVQNTAQVAYGGFHALYLDSYNPIDGPGRVDFVFCTYADNRYEYDHDRDAEGSITWFTLPGDIWEIPFVSAFGCVIADDDFSSIYPRYETPDEGNGYNYFAPPQKALSDGMLKDNESQPLYEIPSAAVKTVLNGRFDNSIGRFYVGRNYSPAVTLRLDAAGGTVGQSEVPYTYGCAAALPEPSRAGYTFDGWATQDGADFTAGRLMFGTDVKTIDLYAKWSAAAWSESERENNTLPPWGIALIVFGGITIIGAGVLLVLRRRRLTPAEETLIPTHSDPPLMNENGLHDLARLYNLTAREKEIAALLIEGKTQRAIAQELFISVETVKTHVKNVYDKLDVKSKYELFAKAQK